MNLPYTSPEDYDAIFSEKPTTESDEARDALLHDMFLTYAAFFAMAQTVEARFDALYFVNKVLDVYNAFKEEGEG